MTELASPQLERIQPRQTETDFDENLDWEDGSGGGEVQKNINCLSSSNDKMSALFGWRDTHWDLNLTIDTETGATGVAFLVVRQSDTGVSRSFQPPFGQTTDKQASNYNTQRLEMGMEGWRGVDKTAGDWDARTRGGGGEIKRLEIGMQGRRGVDKRAGDGDDEVWIKGLEMGMTRCG